MRKSLRELGGNGTQHRLENTEAKLGKLMQQVVDSTPELVVRILMDTTHPLHNAYEELLNKNILTDAQYRILGTLMIELKEHGDRENQALVETVRRASWSIRHDLRQALGWPVGPPRDSNFDNYA